MIRRLNYEDVDVCNSIFSINFGIEGYSYDIKSELLSSFIKTQFIIPEYYVYEEENIIKGVGGLNNVGWDDSVFGICSCYILPEFQSKGIGKTLTKFRIDRIKELGGEIIFSTTKKVWHLERFGFKVINSPYKTWKIMQLNIG